MHLFGSFFARTDSGSANNPALNLTKAPAIEIVFSPFTATGQQGDWILDRPTGGGVDPDTQVIINGTSYSFTYQLSGTLPVSNNNGANQVPVQFRGEPVVIITVQNYPTPGTSTRLTFLPQSDATEAEMNAFGKGAIAIQNVSNNPQPTPICFVEGTRIATPSGPAAIETLRVGDLVLVDGDTPAPILWIDRTRHDWMGPTEASQPIFIAANAFGPGRPSRNLKVSPQHRILLRGDDVLRRCGVAEVLVPAKALVGLKGVRQMTGLKHAVYYHMLLARHSVVTAEDLATESFYPGRSALAALRQSQRAALTELFPGVADNPEAAYGGKARMCLTVRETQDLIRVRLVEAAAQTGGTTAVHPFVRRPTANPVSVGKLRTDTSRLATAC